MKQRDIVDLILLAAIWGGSFLFMRYAAPAFGAVALIWLRVAIAAACLMPLLVGHAHLAVLRERAVPIGIMGIFNSALPFVLIAWATLSLTAGFASILNATTPIFAALIAAVWLGDRLGAGRTLGLVLGFAGVLTLAAGKADFRPGGSGWAVVAMLVATFSYGYAANYTRRHLAGVPALVNAAGSQLISAVALLPFAIHFWPARSPDAKAWAAAVALGVVCTALAYLLYFRLIARIGAARTVSVTFLIPVFGTLWGALFLAETVTLQMLAGGVVILLGTALATGLLRGRRTASA